MLRVILRTDRIVEAVVEYIRTQETPDRYLHQLRRVEIADFSGSEPEIEHLRYLLASGKGIEEMVITPCHTSLSDDARLMNRLMQLPRASPTALLFV
ncbi:hypothetical protein ACS0TY_007630 [Phlomoides rotata]